MSSSFADGNKLAKQIEISYATRGLVLHLSATDSIAAEF